MLAMFHGRDRKEAVFIGKLGKFGSISRFIRVY